MVVDSACRNALLLTIAKVVHKTWMFASKQGVVMVFTTALICNDEEKKQQQQKQTNNKQTNNLSQLALMKRVNQ